MRTIILLVLFVLITLILIPVLLFCYVFRCSQPIIWAGRQALKMAPKILGIRLDIDGVDKIEREKPYIFMSNHLSFLDGPLLFLIIPQSIRVILKKEIFRIPIIGLGMRQVEFVPVDRIGIRGGKKSIDRAALLIREKKYSFLIFPEGTRSLDGQLQSFRRGGFFLALDSQAPIIPISIQGTFELMPKRSFFVRKGTIRVIFHSPVSVENHDTKSLPELMSKVRSIIQEGLS
jgi:1-acyl-sn-glycerol-3-phosphate acyltransferase